MEDIGEIEAVRKAAHGIDPTRDLDITVQSPDGKVFILDAFRRSKDKTHLLGRISSPGSETDEFMGEEVFIPPELEVTKSHHFEYVRRHKEVFISVGAAVVTIAAGAGILVRRHHKSK